MPEESPHGKGGPSQSVAGLERVKSRMRRACADAGHDASAVTLVAVSKTYDAADILPVLSAMGKFTMVVTSAVIPIPKDWVGLDRLTVAVSVDGLPPEHDARRHRVQ